MKMTVASKRRTRLAAAPVVTGRRVVDAEEAAAILTGLGQKTSVSTLKRRRSEGGGPPYVRIGRKCMYPLDLLHEYADRRVAAVVRSTAEEPLFVRSGVGAPELLARKRETTIRDTDRKAEARAAGRTG